VFSATVSGTRLDLRPVGRPASNGVRQQQAGAGIAALRSLQVDDRAAKSLKKKNDGRQFVPRT
jgi:hypothetical protein